MPSLLSFRRRVAVVAAAAVLGTGLALSSALPAAADETRSFPGCPLLIEGMSDSCVQQLQTKLNTVNAAYSLEADAHFGRDTRIAVLDFQGRNDLPADGNVGSITADELDRQQPAPDQPPTGQPAATTCKEGSRAESKRMAEESSPKEWKATSDELEMTLRYSEKDRCYWALLNGFRGDGTVAVWLDRRPKGGDDNTIESLGRHTATLSHGTYSAPYGANAGQEVRACSETIPFNWSGLKETEPSADALPEVKKLCTGWF